MIPIGVWVSTLWFNKLPPDLQKIVVDVGRETEDPIFRLSLDFDQRGAQMWRDNGAEVIKLSTEDRAEFMRRVRSVADEVMGKRHHTFMTMSGLEARYDITEAIDVGLRGSALANWNLGTMQYSFGPSIGYAFSDAIWVSAGYNVVGYEDDDFTAAGYTSSGIFTQFRARLDSSDAEEAAKWFVEN